MSDMLPSGVRILVIEDDHDLLLLLDKMLRRIGAEPELAETGAKGLAALYAKKFDLLILDLMLPDIDGFEILTEIRGESKYNAMPILILSAIVDADSISKGLEMGADGYLTKPYLPNTLTSRVRSMLQQGRRKNE